MTSTIASGGVDPDAAFAFASGSGFEDLVVGNAGDGELALFEGGPGRSESGVGRERAELARPDGAGVLGVDRRPGAVLRGDSGPRVGRAGGVLSSGIETGPISSFAASSSASSVAQLVPLTESSLPLVATVLTLTITVSGDEFNLGLETEHAVAAFLPGTGISVGQGLSSQGRGGPNGDDDAAIGRAASGCRQARSPAVITPWERIVIGLDEALEQFQRDNPNGFSGAPARDAASDRADSPPAADVPAQSGPTSWNSGSNVVPSGDEPDRTENRSKSLDVEAIDAIIQSVWGEDNASASREQLSIIGQQSGRSRDVLSPIPLVHLPSTDHGQRTTDNGPSVLPFGFETGNDEPELALKSLIVATMATEWLHAWQRHRTVGSWRAGSPTNSGKRSEFARSALRA